MGSVCSWKTGDPGNATNSSYECSPPGHLLQWAEWGSPKHISPRTEEWGLPGNTVFADRIHEGAKMHSFLIRVALHLMTAGLIRCRRGDTDTEEKPHVDGCRIGRHAATSPETPGAPKAGRGRKDPLLAPLEGARLCPTCSGPALPGCRTSGLQSWGRMHPWDFNSPARGHLSGLLQDTHAVMD